jgi:hypothetical protein
MKVPDLFHLGTERFPPPNPRPGRPEHELGGVSTPTRAATGHVAVAGKLFFEDVILSEAKDLLFVSIESEADPSLVQHRHDLRMTLLMSFSAACKKDEIFDSSMSIRSLALL